MVRFHICFLLLLFCAGCPAVPDPSQKPDPQAERQPMPNPLQARAKAYLERPIPEGRPYVADNLTDGFIAQYAAEGKIDHDPEVMELMQICILEAELAAEAPDRPPEQQAFFRESAEILKDIHAEMESRR